MPEIMDKNTDAPLVVDPFKRTIVIPNKGKILGVFGDTQITKVIFKIEKYYDGTNMFDTFKHDTRINYVNANGESGFYQVPESDIVQDPDDENAFLVTWIVDYSVTQYVGNVKFSISMLVINEDEEVVLKYGTTIATAKVLDGLDPTDLYPPEKQTELLAQLDRYIDDSLQPMKDDISSIMASIGEIGNRLDDINGEVI